MTAKENSKEIMYQLPGPLYSPDAHPPRVSMTPRIGSFVIIWLLLAAGYGFYRYALPHNPPPATKLPAQVVQPELSDLARHLEEITAMTRRNDTQLRATDSGLRHLLTTTDNAAEARQIRAMLAGLSAARQETERIQAELEFVRSTLNKGEQQK